METGPQWFFINKFLRFAAEAANVILLNDSGLEKLLGCV